MFVNTVVPEGSILDVGPGAGKYGKMLSNPKRFVDGVEIFEPYVEKFGLRKVYRKIFVKNICQFDCGEKEYDLAIFGDILEHLSIDDAKAVLAKFEKKMIPALVLVPYSYEQEAINGNDHEEHLQPDLTEEIFHKRYPGFTRIFGNTYQGVFFKGRNK